VSADGEFLTLKEVALYLHLHERTIYNWAQAGSIPAAKLGGTWRFRKSEIDAWVEKHKNTASPRPDLTGLQATGRTNTGKLSEQWPDSKI
jgi:excisionase family DNA binding protein